MLSSSITTLLSSVALAAAFLHPIFAAKTPSAIGFHTGSVSGYHVSDVSWRVDPRDIHRLAGVTFRLDAPARSAQASIGSASASCEVSGMQARCSFASEPLVATASSLQVSAVS